MKMKFGAIVTDGRGKIGGHVASKNRSGAYLRTKVTPINRQSSYQQAIRARLTAISQAFRGLTAAQVLAWNSAVADFKKNNIFGDSVQLSGAQLYQRLNNNLSVIGQSLLTQPPLPVSVANMGTLTLTGAKGTPALSLAFTTAIAVGESVKLYATAGVSNGKKFVKSEYRLIDILTSADTTPANILAAYTAKFGAMPVAGMQIFVKAVNVSNTTGIEGQSVSASCVVAA